MQLSVSCFIGEVSVHVSDVKDEIGSRWNGSGDADLSSPVDRTDSGKHSSVQ